MIGVPQESLWTPSTSKQKGAYQVNSRLACTCTCIYNREQTPENMVNSHDSSHPRPRVIHQDWDISSLSTQGPRLARYAPFCVLVFCEPPDLQKQSKDSVASLQHPWPLWLTCLCFCHIVIVVYLYNESMLADNKF